TAGDWRQLPNGDLEITVSEMADRRHVLLVAVHELIEAILCEARGISEEAVTEFDLIAIEADPTAEPGDDPRAPYQREHCFATGIERLLAAALEVPWAGYENSIDALMEQKR
ncbi:MAG: hypothetical protein KGL39_43240, partial [Patescibacteria group bacterium]|nr:hypothetical protein [Patescibacteria group bacterium]